ncbi:MAG: bifunctional proline dehydrogenase/L-glutamate gamma-semialdehyde dehydrogenase, partial [Alphaproteobacteria bacterium]|nr:bifunctional proline dehydrogenase/L-glutamate gamma-semialdehyde dehydrogenase [Alphaproteobacteria bacterium]
QTRRKISATALVLVEKLRADDRPGLMEVFLAEYGLSSKEGVALMCLAEALLRVPDQKTIDALIEDKIAPSAWGSHLGKSSSSLVNASTCALLLTGKVLDEGGEGISLVLHRAVKRLGEPVIRLAVQRAMRELGHQFVLGRTIGEARARGKSARGRGCTFSYDMLGEAALTAGEARGYFDAYSSAIAGIADGLASDNPRENPGLSVKLSALHPRFEVSQRHRVMDELVGSCLALARQAKKAGIGFTIDAEEADRLELSLDVIAAVLRDPDLAGWAGFGVVVQAYSRRAGPVLDWLCALAGELDRKINVRLVKGAYWDSEIKRAQVEGLQDFPVFTTKAATDVAFICCAKKLFGFSDRIFPQFATHNAHTMAAVLELAPDKDSFEFQRLQGMGEALHALVGQKFATRCRIYAPVGAHRDLLAYLVRRLLENGANSSFVNLIVNTDVPARDVAADPFEKVLTAGPVPASAIVLPARLFGQRRENSRGRDLNDPIELEAIEAARAPFRKRTWLGQPLLVDPYGQTEKHTVFNPADPGDRVGEVIFAGPADVRGAIGNGQIWKLPPQER